jgi:uncharacterized protein involved in response to NO
MKSSTPGGRTDDPSISGFDFSEHGPRLFFLLAILYGAAVLVLWVVLFRLQLPQAVSPVLWHAHEMLYGVAAAAMVGLLLGLVPRWSNAAPVGTAGLALLAVVWLLGRVAMALIGTIPPWPAAIVDLAFLPVFAGIVIVPLLTARPGRNLLMLGLCAILWAGDLTMHAGWLGWTYETAERGARIGMDAYLLLIAVLGGYAVPELTNRALQAQGVRATARSFPLLDGLAILSLALYLLSDAMSGTSAATRWIALAAAVLNGARLLLWQGVHIRHAPMLWSLHLGYFWLVVGLLIEAAALIGGPVVHMAAVHVLTAGAIGTMVIAVVARAGVAHKGPLLAAHPMVIAAYALVSLAAILRITALFVPDQFVNLVIASGSVWTLGFFVFLIACVSTTVFGRVATGASQPQATP